MDANYREYAVHKTFDYGLFKRLEGNRPIDEARVKKIIDSIKKVGYVISPVIVNENFEIIDGQGRVEALKRLELPVDYIIDPGKGIDECIAMNINQTKWKMMDYINSYAEIGNTSYQNIQFLINKYKCFTLNVILYAVNKRVELTNETIKNGKVLCTDDMKAEADVRLAWLKDYIDPIKKVGGRAEYYMRAFLFCYDDQEVDNERLIQKITAYQASLEPVSNTLQALECIENAYNNRAKGKKVYIKTNYLKYLDGKYPWYGNKYGNRYCND